MGTLMNGVKIVQRIGLVMLVDGGIGDIPD